MDAQAIGAVGSAVVLLTQIVKWSGLPDHRAPLVVLFLSALGVGIWGFSHGTLVRAQVFDYFAGWIVVAATAAGVFGFTRSMASAVTSTKEPPPGAGASHTEKM